MEGHIIIDKQEARQMICNHFATAPLDGTFIINLLSLISKPAIVTHHGSTGKFKIEYGRQLHEPAATPSPRVPENELEGIAKQAKNTG